MSAPATRTRELSAAAERPLGPVRTIAVAGAKGGVGKSVVATNLATALGRAGREVLLFDADLALGDVARLLDIPALHGVDDVIAGRRCLADLVLQGPSRVSVIPATYGDPGVSRLSRNDHAALVALFSGLGTAADTMLVDTASGLSDASLSYAGAAREVLVVASDEPTAILDAMAVMRILNERYRIRRFRVLANEVESARHGLDVYARLADLIDPATDLLLDYAGSVPSDPHVVEAVRRQQSVIELFPRSPAALAFAKLAARVSRWPRPATPAGHIEFFVERLVQAAGPTW